MKNIEYIGELLKILIYTQSESLKEQKNNGPTAILQRLSTTKKNCMDKYRISYEPKEGKNKQTKRLHKENHIEFLQHKANKKPQTVQS